MKTRLLPLLVLTSSALAAVPPQCKNWPKKPAWEWTLEERMHYRLDRACATGRRVFAGGRGPFVIDGDDTPELFVPTELFNLFVLRPRNIIEAQARAARFELPPKFFAIVDAALGDYRRGEQTCRARFAALTRVRAAFPRMFFDRFLYTVIAPGVTSSSDDPGERTRWFERGCP